MEMDIYMRRRLVALGGLVLFFIFFVLLVRSCGGDDEPGSPLTPVGTTGGDGTVALSKEEFIQAADQICAPAEAAIAALDPAASNAARQEARIAANELDQVQALEVAEQERLLNRFFSFFEDRVAALRSLATAVQRGDDVAAGEAQVAVDEAEVEARTLGERYGFSDCGQFLDPGQAPGEGGEATGEATGEAPTDAGGGVAPTTETPSTETPTTPTEPGDSGDAGGGIAP